MERHLKRTKKPLFKVEGNLIVSIVNVNVNDLDIFTDNYEYDVFKLQFAHLV